LRDRVHTYHPIFISFSFVVVVVFLALSRRNGEVHSGTISTTRQPQYR
jgi:hypothetical protein